MFASVFRPARTGVKLIYKTDDLESAAFYRVWNERVNLVLFLLGFLSRSPRTEIFTVLRSADISLR